MTPPAGTPTVVDHLGVDGPAAPPRANGELLFAEPWESRAFGVAVALADEGVFGLDEFQHALIDAIAEWDLLGRAPEDYRYYECWLVALERLVARNGSATTLDIDERAAEYLARPAGYDHDHDHDHHHDDHHHHDHEHGAH